MSPQAHRPTRTTIPHTPPEPSEIAAPPTLGDDVSPTPFQFLLPVIGALTSVTMMVVLRNGQPLFLMIAAIVFLVAVVGGLGFAISSRGRAARQLRVRRKRYLDYLESTRNDLRERSAEALANALALHPDANGLATFVRDPERLWERRRSDADHMQARVGTATVPWFRLRVPSSDSPIEPSDPILLQEAELIAKTHASIEGMPAVARLGEAAVVAIIGDRERTVPLARGLIAQLASHQTPEDVRIAAAHPPERAGDWAGLDLLPHMQDPQLFDGPVPARRIAPDLEALANIVGRELVDRTQLAAAARRRGTGRPDVSRFVVLADGHGGPAGRLPLPDPSMHARDLGVVLVHLLDDRLDEPDDVDIRIDLREEPSITHGARGADPQTTTFAPDEVSGWQLETIARVLAAGRTVEAVREEGGEAAVADVVELLGTDPAAPAPLEAMWRPRPATDFLRVAFAADDRGRPVHLDLKESAQQGMGPHGICIGATGSGKSEMLRTLILSLAATHPPEDLAMILVDYKGGAAFAPFARLPHLAGLIDNLADDPQLTERARASLQGEVVRRQQLLKEAGSSPSITHYRQLRRERPELPRLPHLFVVIDEFGELLTAEPDFIDLFLQIGRIGRSIGVHLLLSSQRIEAGKLRGLDTYLSYRLGLRTFSEAESQLVLDTVDAFNLPPLPGYGYLKVDTSVYQRFRSGFVSGPLAAPARPVGDEEAGPTVFELPVFNGIASGDEPSAAPVLHRPDTGRTLVDELVEHLSAGERVPPVWLPPLPQELALGHVLERSPRSIGRLDIVIGLEDDPAKQRQEPWRLDLTKAGGHAVVIGGPQSGRSTALRTIGASLALQRTPREVAIYGMDLTGGGLRRLEPFPHVGGVASRGDEGRLQRLLEELRDMLQQRETLFKTRRIDSMPQLRRMHAAAELPELESADVVVLVDGYGALRSDFEHLEEPFTALMLQASSYGIHFVLTLGRWGELRMAHQSLFGNRIELRLNDPADSIIERKLARTISPETPGRALSDASTLAQFALPTLDVVEPGEVGAALEELARRTAESWSGPAAAPIRLLPGRIDPATLPGPEDEPAAVPFGLRQDTMDTAFWEFSDSDQHLLVLGDAKSGKSALLRTIARGMVDRFDPSELAIAVVDPRGHVPGAVPAEYLAAHAKSAQQAAGLAASIASELAKRPEREPGGPRGPKIVLLVDDHDIVSAGGGEPLAALLPHLPAARDLDLHVIATRPVAGSVRALYGPFLQGVRDTGGAVLLLSGDRGEGQILPRLHPERMPPGRGRYVRRGELPHVVQIAETPRTEAQG
ncbi:MAG: type VII secretion protein EccCa [Pseudoclavibacter sp.]|nr:type VII secretion protein EccCa [Pseudoclavibacter sp.]